MENVVEGLLTGGHGNKGLYTFLLTNCFTFMVVFIATTALSYSKVKERRYSIPRNALIINPRVTDDTYDIGCDYLDSSKKCYQLFRSEVVFMEDVDGTKSRLPLPFLSTSRYALYETNWTVTCYECEEEETTCSFTRQASFGEEMLLFMIFSAAISIALLIVILIWTSFVVVVTPSQ